MEYLQALILGIVQGVTEFLPISSTAHLIIVRDVFQWGAVTCPANLADCIPRAGWSKEAIDGIQFGSVIAVVLYFWKDITQLLSGAWQALMTRNWAKEEWRIVLGIAIGSIPALAAGLALKISGIKLESPQNIGLVSIVMALLLGGAESYGKRSRGFNKLKTSDGIIVGLAQMIALLPGASRSGSTLTAALFLGLERATAARFSFLLGLPVLTIVTLVQAKDALQEKAMFGPMAVGIVSTLIFSYLSIAWLIKFLQRQSAWLFVFYRLAFGLALLFAVFNGWKPEGT
jgi:undecaprenyl-diphosphatase